ncbi:aspartate kinase [Roseiflexus sp.]|uniref:aspartate kinase n=1 Tax=Roseiflexus sp. TaxID=2562120 RepID=UPI0021DE1306|nr:aspartate kinase [Roseiflexus sp.]GIW02109.1 MAG: aspartokinase [Roseiflexus sp.]
MVVMKFGAAAVSDASRINDLVRVVRHAVDEGQALIVVCTAMPEVTNLLIGAARAAARGNLATAEQARRALWQRHRTLAERLVADEWERETLYQSWADLLKSFDRIVRALATLGEHSPRSSDAIAAIGERFIGLLLAVALRRAGVAAQLIDGAELIVTDDHFGNARPLPEETAKRARARLLPLAQSRIVPVVTGYIGATRQHLTTTLGRGGGDYSATLIAAALDADEVVLWTDVAGILTADPKLAPEARTLPELSYLEAAEIATLGAEVLHPRTLTPLAHRNIPLHIRNLAQPDMPGTRVVAEPCISSDTARTIISAPAISLIEIAMSPLAAADLGWAPELAVRVLAELTNCGIEVLTFAQSFSERSLLLAVRTADVEYAYERIETCLLPERENQALRTISLRSPVALVAVLSAPGSAYLAPRALASLARVQATVLAMVHGNASRHLSFIVPEEEMGSVVRALHRDLMMG